MGNTPEKSTGQANKPSGGGGLLDAVVVLVAFASVHGGTRDHPHFGAIGRGTGMDGGAVGSSPSPPAPPPLHPAIAPLSFLLGRWRGEGEGGFPTINSFRYGEELQFSHSGKPVIAYSQKTWKLTSGEPMHAESGYWRPKPDGSIDVVIAQSTGLVEVQKGSYDAEHKIVTLQSELVGNAAKVKEITRVFKAADGNLSYVVQMATHLTSLQPHLKALLKKI